MIRVKTFTSPLQIFHVKEELNNLDRSVNRFIEENNMSRVISVSDAITTNEEMAHWLRYRLWSYRYHRRRTHRYRLFFHQEHRRPVQRHGSHDEHPDRALRAHPGLLS
jgi:hypothetical protein